MSTDLPPPIAPPPAVDAAATEAAATRRRWVSLGEFVAVAGLIIGGVSLWLTWNDRQTDQAEKRAAQTSEARQAARYDIAATLDTDGSLTFQRDERHALGDVTLAFPDALGIGTRTTPTATVPKSWYASALLKVTDGGPDAQTGTLPVLVTVRYWDNDTQRSVSGIYDIVWQTEAGKGLGMFGGRTLRVVGFKRHASGGTQTRLDALWLAARMKR